MGGPVAEALGDEGQLVFSVRTDGEVAVAGVISVVIAGAEARFDRQAQGDGAELHAGSDADFVVNAFAGSVAGRVLHVELRERVGVQGERSEEIGIVQRKAQAEVLRGVERVIRAHVGAVVGAEGDVLVEHEAQAGCEVGLVPGVGGGAAAAAADVARGGLAAVEAVPEAEVHAHFAERAGAFIDAEAEVDVRLEDGSLIFLRDTAGDIHRGDVDADVARDAGFRDGLAGFVFFCGCGGAGEARGGEREAGQGERAGGCDAVFSHNGLFWFSWLVLAAAGFCSAGCVLATTMPPGNSFFSESFARRFPISLMGPLFPRTAPAVNDRHDCPFYRQDGRRERGECPIFATPSTILGVPSAARSGPRCRIFSQAISRARRSTCRGSPFARQRVRRWSRGCRSSGSRRLGRRCPRRFGRWSLRQRRRAFHPARSRGRG